MTNIPWKQEDHELMAKYAAEFMSSQMIADRLTAETGRPRTRNAIIGCCNRTGVKLHRNFFDGAKKTKQTKALKVLVEGRNKKKSKTTIKKENTLVPVKKEKPPSPTTLPLDESKFVLIQQLSSRTCRFPVKNITPNSYWYCGDQPNGTSVYCEGHANICFQPSRVRR